MFFSEHLIVVHQVFKLVIHSTQILSTLMSFSAPDGTSPAIHHLPGRRSLASFSTHPEARGFSRFSRNVQALALPGGRKQGSPFFGDLWEVSILIPTCLFFFEIQFRVRTDVEGGPRGEERWDQGGKGW